MFKTMGYSPGLLLKIGRFPTPKTSIELLTNNLLNSYDCIYHLVGDVLWSLRRFPGRTKSAMVKTMGYSPGLLIKIGRFGTLENALEIFASNPLNTYNCIYRRVGDVLCSLR